MRFDAREFSTRQEAEAFISTQKARYPGTVYKVIALDNGRFNVGVQQSLAAFALCA